MSAALTLAFLALNPSGPLPDISLDDLKQFPSPEYVRGECAFAYEHMTWAHHNACAEWSREAYDLWNTWDDLVRAMDADRWPETYRRESLRIVYRKIGGEAYLQGRMPPPVPYWRFKERP